jgi:Ca2+-binding EF-hand superfamily protein
VTNKPVQLKESDIKFLSQQTGLDKATIKNIFDKFMANNPDGRLDRAEFVRLYDELRSESKEALDEISDFVFRVFDTDRNGTINFNEFMVAYALTSRGDPVKKLEYAFSLYDTDGNGYLDRNELRTVLTAMLDLLGADKKNTNVPALVNEIVTDLDKSHDGRITKDEFVKGLAANYSLRALMSPFN